MAARETLDVLRDAARWFEPSPEGFGPLLDFLGEGEELKFGYATTALWTLNSAI